MAQESGKSEKDGAADAGLHLAAMQAALAKINEAILMMELVARTYSFVHLGRADVEDAGKFLYDAVQALKLGHGKAAKELTDKARKIAGV